MKEAQGLSESEVVVNLVHKALQIDGDVQYGAMLRPVIQDQIHKDIQSYSNRNANISFQALYAAEQNRLLSIHVLRFLTDLVDSPETGSDHHRLPTKRLEQSQEDDERHAS